MPFHLIASLSGGRRKSLYNKSEQQVLTAVIQFHSSGTITAKWGAKSHTYQVLELRVYKTKEHWHKGLGGSFETFLGKKKRNLYSGFAAKADQALGKKTHRVFVIMPIQGAKFGSQDEQRIFREYDERFEKIEKVLGPEDCVAIRIDKEHPLDDLVARIKDEIHRAAFVVADLTDERPSCYFEAGYAEADRKPVIYIASQDSVINPKVKTKIHFDVHMSVNYFTNHQELAQKLDASVKKNRSKLFPTKEQVGAVEAV